MAMSENLNWLKYEEYRPIIMKSIRKRFAYMSDDDYYDIFSDAYIWGIKKFENSFNPGISKNEKGFLYSIVLNRIKNIVEKNKRINPDKNYEPKDTDSSDLNDLSSEDVKLNTVINGESFSTNEFFIGLFKNKNIINPNQLSENYLVKANYMRNVPLIKQEAWSYEKSINAGTLEMLMRKNIFKRESPDYLFNREPLSVVKLLSWISNTIL